MPGCAPGPGSQQGSPPPEPLAVEGTATAPASPALRYAGRRLADVLDELRAAGLKLVYSSRLVKPQMLVRDEPKAREGRALLDEVLAPHDLTTRLGPADTVIVVQRSTAEAEGPQPEGMRLGFREQVDVAGSPEAQLEAGPAPLRLTGHDVQEVPGAVDNVFRALQLMPGVTAVHNPFRLFGAVAGPNPDTVNRFELTAGAFPARFGDRLSSVLVVETRDGRRDRPFGGSVSTSVTDSSAVFEGRLPGPGSWLLAGRRT